MITITILFENQKLLKIKTLAIKRAQKNFSIMSLFLKFGNGSNQTTEEINITPEHMKTLGIFSMLRKFKVADH